MDIRKKGKKMRLKQNLEADIIDKRFYNQKNKKKKKKEKETGR